MWVVKIGGSWIKNPKLYDLIQNLGKFSRTTDIIIVNGGGCFTDSVRSVYSEGKMSEKTGHYIALKATEMFSNIMKEINKDICLIENIDSIKRYKKKLKIWLPSEKLKEELTFSKTWSSTSDSVAAWLHKRIRSNGLLFIKSLKLEKKKYKLSYLQERQVLDKDVNKYLKGQNRIRIIGPEIIDLLKINNEWNELFENLSEIEL